MQNNNNIFQNYKGIIDTTLREGAQYRYSSFSLSQQILIVKFLSKIGVDRIEVGNPIIDEVRKNIVKLVQIPQRSKILSHIRNRFSDIDLAIFANKKEFNIIKFEKVLNRKIQVFQFNSLNEVKNKELLNNIINGCLLTGRLKL